MTRSLSPRRPASRRGAVAVVAALCLIPLLGVLALVLDGGVMMAERRKAQAAADAASFAGVCAMSKAANGDPQAASYAAAFAYAEANGFSNDGENASVVVRPPQSPSRFAGDPQSVEVVITSHRPRLFSAAFGVEPLGVSARSVSRWATSGYSLLVLDPSAASSLSVAGSARLATTGSIQVNSSDAGAVDANNAGVIEALDSARPPTLQVVGNVKKSSGGVILVPVQAGSPTAADRLASTLAAPSPSGLPARSVPQGWFPQNPYPLYPGVYSNGMSLGSGGMKYTMAPGLYYLTSGDFSVVNGVGVTGQGVTIYLHNGDVNIQGGNGVNLTAPASGAFQGLVIHQRAHDNPSASRSIAIANGTNNKLQGAIYAPSAVMNVAGGSTTDQFGTALVVKRLNLSNNARVRLSDTVGASSTVRLVE